LNRAKIEMMDKINSILAQGYMAAKIVWRTFKVRVWSYKKYAGNAKQIIRQIIDGCWVPLTGSKQGYFCASADHFHDFWMRDFSMSSSALIKLGYKDKVQKTLEYALKIFKRDEKITTTIVHNRAVDMPAYASDSLPYLIHALRVLGNKKLIKKYQSFLERQAKIYWEIIWDKRLGTVRQDIHFAAAKDMVKRQASCYDTCMVGMLARDLQALSLKNPIEANISKLLMKRYFAKEYFLDDLSGRKYLSADAQIFPFWTGLIDDKKILKKIIAAVHAKKMDRPFPIKHTERRIKKIERLQGRLFVPNYQGSTIWTQVGALWIELVSQIDPALAQKYIRQYKNHIEKYQTFFEVFHPNGKPYQSLLYVTDEGMLWSSIFLAISL